ncbi:hypothetical protein [Allocoleopsis sp.]|uniref:hypothetical protein n=1 Tax=Allocoleopsis sp. TaxID=3088169 RepID=UPI002FD354EF
MKFLRIFMIGLLFIGLIASTGYALEQNQNRLKIEDITLQVFDRSTNKLSPLSPLPNPYGMDMDVLVTVKVRGNQTPPSNQVVQPQKIRLVVDGKEYTTAATGKVSSWKETQTRSVFIAPEKEISYIPFLIEYKCYPNVAFTASVSTSSLWKSFPLSCAE